jgi:hypothetical protein
MPLDKFHNAWVDIQNVLKKYDIEIWVSPAHDMFLRPASGSTVYLYDGISPEPSDEVKAETRRFNEWRERHGV